MYNSETGQWVTVADFPGKGRRGAVAFSLNGKGYIGLGQNDQEVERFNDFWEYTPVSNSWRRITDFPSISRSRAVSFVIGDKAYVGFGISHEKLEKDFFSYDPTKDLWSPIKDFPTEARFAATAFSDEEVGYIVGGNSCCGSYASIFSEVWKYDPKENLWIFHSIYPFEKRTQMLKEDFYQYGIIGLGVTLNGKLFSDIYLFNPSQNNWSSLPEFPQKRFNAMSFIIDSTLYVGGGEDRINNQDDSLFYKLDLRQSLLKN